MPQAIGALSEHLAGPAIAAPRVAAATRPLTFSHPHPLPHVDQHTCKTTQRLLVALRAYGCSQQACLHFAESLSFVFLQSFAHFFWPTPRQPVFALGLQRRCTFFESFVVHVVGSSSAAQLTDSMGKGGGNEGGLGGGGQLPEAHPIAQASEA